eukprot:TRINITY_DN23316_c0_g2_i2.p1 TRINITY_DN23316_c0_g2~~TRINITY_DN23316_c0_g2_i2.p1  ORF type:complete len:441 (+),score=68.44 TRINITY_DN23316_c0_g2_i2:53-1324(+)
MATRSCGSLPSALALVCTYFLLGKIRAGRVHIASRKQDLSSPACDFPAGTSKVTMMRVEGMPFAWNPVLDVQGTSVELLKAAVFFNVDDVASLGGQCLTACSVLDYKNVPPKKAKMSSSKSCKNAFLNAFEKNADYMPLQERVVKVAKSKLGSAQFKLCCALTRPPDEATPESVLGPGSPLTQPMQISASAFLEGNNGAYQDRSLVMQKSKFSLYAVFDGHGPRGSYGALGAEAAEAHFSWTFKDTFEKAGDEGLSNYMANMDASWERAHHMVQQAGSGLVGTTATVVVTQSKPWHVRVWWAGDSKAKILNTSIETEPHSCSGNHPKADWSTLAWYCKVAPRKRIQVTRSLGEQERFVQSGDLKYEAQFADWSEKAPPGSVILIGSDGLWDAPVNAVIGAHFRVRICTERLLKWDRFLGLFLP